MLKCLLVSAGLIVNIHFLTTFNHKVNNTKDLFD